MSIIVRLDLNQYDELTIERLIYDGIITWKEFEESGRLDTLFKKESTRYIWSYTVKENLKLRQDLTSISVPTRMVTRKDRAS